MMYIFYIFLLLSLYLFKDAIHLLFLIDLFIHLIIQLYVAIKLSELNTNLLIHCVLYN